MSANQNIGDNDGTFKNQKVFPNIDKQPFLNSTANDKYMNYAPTNKALGAMN